MKGEKLLGKFVKSKIMTAVTVFVAVLCLLCGCIGIHKHETQKEPMQIEEVTVISDLAYDKNPELGYRVYIKEAGILKPYLVLTDNYDGSGNTLLLREYILHELRRYNGWSDKAGYYNGCEIDKWLNGEFLGMLETDPVYSLINIGSLDEIGLARGETEEILRKVFLLSRMEVGAEYDTSIPSAEEPLAYFDDYTKRAAYRENGSNKGCSWYLRSVSTWYASMPSSLTTEGAIGYVDATIENGVRPAFCLDSDTEVELWDNLEEGERFVIKQNGGE